MPLPCQAIPCITVSMSYSNCRQFYLDSKNTCNLKAEARYLTLRIALDCGPLHDVRSSQQKAQMPSPALQPLLLFPSQDPDLPATGTLCTALGMPKPSRTKPEALEFSKLCGVAPCCSLPAREKPTLLRNIQQ